LPKLIGKYLLFSFTNGQKANTVFVSVGEGSWAHAVVMYYKAADPNSCIIAVEPAAAECPKESLHCGKLQAISTGHTIMAGMCCGTPSSIAFPVLRDGISVALTVNEEEAHQSVYFFANH
jgi:diaminopropionate ammonia-lyase